MAYVHSEQFVGDMVRALQHNTINEFKAAYRSLDALLIDDIQFFANKERSQEEFFHTFNALLEDQRQVILTCDRYPKEVNGLEERLKSRFGWGLTVSIDPPELETSVAILMSKAAAAHKELPEEVAFFIAQRIRSNVRELEGALHRVVANSTFTGRPITLEFAKDALRDLLALQDRLVTIENIQKIVAEYSKVRVADLLSKRRNRSITRPAPDRHEPGQGTHQSQPAGDRRPVRRARSHHRAARLPSRETAAGNRVPGARGLPEPDPDPDRVSATHGRSCIARVLIPGTERGYAVDKIGASKSPQVPHRCYIVPPSVSAQRELDQNACISSSGCPSSTGERLPNNYY